MNVEALARVSSDIAARAAAKYLSVHSLNADTGKLSECLSRSVKAALPEALRDAERALNCPGMGDIASHTFIASMTLAGIAAAKEATKQNP